MKKARCKQCGREAMVAVNEVAADMAVGFISAGGRASAGLECAYCGGKQSSSDYDELWHATYEADMTRRIVAAILQKEREKVARLQEGRW